MATSYTPILREGILSKGCYSSVENNRIYEIFFSNGPRYLFRAVNKKYNITNKGICDVGCAYGTNLIYCAPGSYGIDIDSYKVNFARSIGLNVYERDVECDDLSDLPLVEVVWCSAVLEHVFSPHRFLRNVYMLLKPNGLLCMYVPIIPLFTYLERISKLNKYLSGYTGKGHINAFVPDTLRFFCEQAGFKTLETSPFYPGILKFFNHIPLMNRLTGRCVYVGRKNV